MQKTINLNYAGINFDEAEKLCLEEKGQIKRERGEGGRIKYEK